MSDTPTTIDVGADALDNVIQPFQLEVSSLRGRIVRLGSTLDDILTAHDYPKPVAHLVAEISTLALLLSSMMKYDGIFTLQTKGDGPVNMLVADVEDDKNPALGETNLGEDDWRRAMILLDSCTEDEFLDPALDHNSLLLRLFHEEGVRIYAPIMAVKECRCSMERVENMLIMMPAEDRQYMQDNGEISMRCEFCAEEYAFDFAAIERKIKAHENTSS